MLARIRKTQEEREGGFTLIELLVVIIIIGILAAIAIPTFLRQREKGYKADAKSTLKNGATAIESWAVELGGNYSGVTVGNMQSEGFKYDAAKQTVTVPVADATHYCINVVDTRLTGEFWTYNSNTGKPVQDVACV